MPCHISPWFGIEGQVLGLGFEGEILGFGLEGQVLGLAGQVLVNITGWPWVAGWLHTEINVTYYKLSFSVCLRFLFDDGAGYVELCMPLRVPGVMTGGKPLR